MLMGKCACRYGVLVYLTKLQSDMWMRDEANLTLPLPPARMPPGVGAARLGVVGGGVVVDGVSRKSAAWCRESRILVDREADRSEEAMEHEGVEAGPEGAELEGVSPWRGNPRYFGTILVLNRRRNKQHWKPLTARRDSRP